MINADYGLDLIDNSVSLSSWDEEDNLLKVASLVLFSKLKQRPATNVSKF
jgi:hypothetical protein